MDLFKMIDYLRLGQTYGKNVGAFIYSVMFFGGFCLLLSLILLIIPFNSTDVKNNNMMILASNKWEQKQNNQSELKEQLQFRIYEQASCHQTNFEDNQAKINQHQCQKQSFVLDPSSGIFNTQKIIKIFEKPSSQPSYNFEVLLKQDSIDEKNKSEFRTTFLLMKKASLEINDMIQLGMCDGLITCQEQCNKHSFEWKLLGNENHVCSGIFQVSGICAIVNTEQKYQIRGCYKNQDYESLSFSSSSSLLKKGIQHDSEIIKSVELKVQVIDSRNPIATAFDISQSFSPYEPSPSPYQVGSKILFLIGGIVSCGINLLLCFLKLRNNPKN